MKKIFTLSLLLYFGAATTLLAENGSSAIPATKQSGTISVSVKGLKNLDGMLGIALYITKNGFPDKPERAFATKVIKPNGSINVVTFDNIAYGDYAVSVLHDENSNGKMDKSFFGIPREGFGVSNNPKIRRGPPSFSEALFTLNAKELEITVTLNYM
jgi:uncharacterized protein (DUF2141 family)